MIRAGRLRHTVVIERDSSAARDGFGQPTENWEAFATVQAAIDPIRGREYFAAQQFAAETTHKVTLRYIAGVSPKMRARFGSRIFRIEAVKNPEERNERLELMCVEVLS